MTKDTKMRSESSATIDTLIHYTRELALKESSKHYPPEVEDHYAFAFGYMGSDFRNILYELDLSQNQLNILVKATQVRIERIIS